MPRRSSAYAKLIQAGKVKAIGASNLDAGQLGEALKVAKDEGLPRYEVLQPEYNLYDRGKLDGPLLALCRGEGIGVITYFSLAKGFLSGKYRGEADLGKSPRGGGIASYLNPRGFQILGALDEVALNHDAKPAEVALAWVMAKPGVTAPIASATTPGADGEPRAGDHAHPQRGRGSGAGRGRRVASGRWRVPGTSPAARPCPARR